MLDRASSDMRASEIVERVLRRAGLNEPDGRCLYALRAGPRDVQDLVAIVRSSSPWLVPAQVDSAAVVLLAAEVLCRDYAGGAWSWDPVWSAIGGERNLQEWLYPTLQRGLAWWKREWVVTATRRRYLMTLALEGGLPRQMLSGRRGGGLLGRFLERVLLEHEQYPTGDVVDLARSLGGDLPVSLQQSELYELAGALVMELAKLRRRVGGREDGLEVLDTECVGWRECLPIRFDGDGASELLVRTLLEQPAVERQPAVRPVLDLVLDLNEHRSPEVRRVIRVPARLPADQLWDGEPPPLLDLFLRSEAGLEVRIGEAVRLPEARYRVDIEVNRALSGPEVFGQWTLVVSAAGKQPRLLYLSRGEAIGRVPWSFEPAGGSESCQLAGLGSARAASDHLLVALPTSAERGGGVWESLGLVMNCDRALWRLETESEVCMDGECYRLRPGRPDSLEHALDGALARFECTRGSVFRGPPTLAARENADDPFVPVPSRELEWRSALPGAEWTSCERALGQGVLRRRASGETLFRTHICIVPEDLAITIEGAGAERGDLQVSSSAVTAVDVGERSDLLARVVEKPNGFMVRVARVTDAPLDAKPLLVRLSFGTGSTAELRAPSPVQLAGFVDHRDRPADSGKIITLGELGRWRALEIGAGPRSSALVVAVLEHERKSLIASRALSDEMTGRRSLRLDAFYDAIRETLALDRGRPIDRAVRLELLVDGRQVATLSVREYAFDVRRRREGGSAQVVRPVDGSGAQVDLSDLDAEARPVWRPSGMAVRLATERDGFVFRHKDLYPGWWVVHLVSTDPFAAVRPVAMEVPRRDAIADHVREQAPRGLLEEACCVEFSRLDVALDAALAEIASRPNHPSLEDLLDTVRSFRVLPPSTFRTVERLVRHGSAVALIAYLMSRDEDLDLVWRRLQELPFLWATVPLSAWESAARTVLGDLPAELQHRVGENMLNTLGRRARLWFPAIVVVVDELRHRILGLPPLEVGTSLARMEPNHGQLLACIEAAHQRLRQNQARGESLRRWPRSDLDAIAESLGHSELYGDLRIRPQVAWTDSVLNAPTLAAVAVATGDEIHEAIMRVTKQLRAFDREWFDDALQVQLSRALGYVHPHREEAS